MVEHRHFTFLHLTSQRAIISVLVLWVPARPLNGWSGQSEGWAGNRQRSGEREASITSVCVEEGVTAERLPNSQQVPVLRNRLHKLSEARDMEPRRGQRSRRVDKPSQGASGCYSQNSRGRLSGLCHSSEWLLAPSLSPQLAFSLVKRLGRDLETSALLVEDSFPAGAGRSRPSLCRCILQQMRVWPWPRQRLHLSIPKCHFGGVSSWASRVKFQNLRSLPELPVCLATGLYFHQKNRKRGTYGFYKCQRDADYMPAWEAREGIWTTERFPALYSGGTGNAQLYFRQFALIEPNLLSHKGTKWLCNGQIWWKLNTKEITSEKLFNHP